MFYVYILLSEVDAQRLYIGFTTNLDNRLEQHNSMQTTYAKRYAPWRLHSYVAFQNKDKALAFEKYLKHGSGFAFLKKHLI